MTSIVDTSVKHAYSSMAGAPVINGTAGSLIATLKAFLVTGWGTKAVDSAAISNGVCRLTFASGKSAAEIHSVIALSGASPAALNGEQRVTAVASGWVEFKTDLPDGVVTGSLSFKMPSLGWEELYSKTNVSVFRSTDPSGSRPYLRIDDSNALFARVQMYEQMTDVDTGSAVAPASVSGGYYWHRINSGNMSRYWLLMGDSRGFYWVNAAFNSGADAAQSPGAYGMVSAYFGDIRSNRSGDAWCAFLSGAVSTDYKNTAGCVQQSDLDTGMTLQRASAGVGGAVATSRLVIGGGVSGVNASMGAFPARADNGWYLNAIPVSDGGWVNGPRGNMPGALFCPQSGVAASMGYAVRFTDGKGAFAGKKLLSISIGVPGIQNQGVGVFVASESWRQ